MIFFKKSSAASPSSVSALIVGLGNPGANYEGNRHNIGFMAVDRMASDYHFPNWNKKFQGQLCEGAIDGKKVLLLKPLTYMNLSGEAVGKTARFYKIPVEKIIVLHDELDLPLGKLRVKRSGGNGGHNGLKSIDAHMGKDYVRVRLGIAHPGDREQVTNHVLSDFSKAEQQTVDEQLMEVSRHIGLLLQGDEAGFMNKIALATQEEK
jgi:PTH1 family peptidyl-tRNA hydrolase